MKKVKVEDKFVVLKNIPYKQEENIDSAFGEYLSSKYRADLYLPTTLTKETAGVRASEVAIEADNSPSGRKIKLQGREVDTKCLYREIQPGNLLRGQQTTKRDDDKRTSTPVVIFVHGGGWTRGDKQAWIHFAYRDVNLLLAVYFKLLNVYNNVGETFANNGIACAVISYPLARVNIPWVFLPMAVSYICTVIMVGMALGVAYFLLSITLYYLQFSATSAYAVTEQSNIRKYVSNVVWSGLWSNILILILMTEKRREFLLKKHRVVCIWSAILATCYGIWSVVKCPTVQLWLMFLVTLLITQLVILLNKLVYSCSTYREQATSVAHAFRWIRDICVTTSLLDIKSIYLMGHSAGGHLVSTVAIDNQYLNSVGCSSTDIKGVISVSGVYDVGRLNTRTMKNVYLIPGFGRNPRDWTDASPFHKIPTHSDSTIPEFLVLCAERDFHLIADAENFYKALSTIGVTCRYALIPRTNHFNIIHSFLPVEGAVTSANLCLTFVKGKQ